MLIFTKEINNCRKNYNIILSSILLTKYVVEIKKSKPLSTPPYIIEEEKLEIT